MNTLYDEKAYFDQENNADNVNEIGVSHITEMQIPEFLRKYKVGNSNS